MTFGAGVVDIYSFSSLNDLIYKISISNDILPHFLLKSMYFNHKYDKIYSGWCYDSFIKKT